MNNVHDDGPTVFETRWCLSYLRGPLTREQLKGLKSAESDSATAASTATPAAPMQGAASEPSASADTIRNGGPPALPPDIPQYFVPRRGSGPITYQPRILGIGKVYFADARAGVEADLPVALIAPIRSGPVPVDWDHAEEAEFTDADLEQAPASDAAFGPLPPEAAKARNYAEWKKGFADALYRTRTLSLLRSASLKVVSNPEETERDFRARLALLAREQRDAAADKLRAKYAPKVQTLEERLRRARQAVEVQKEQSRAAKMNTALGFGTAVLGAFLGRKTLSTGNISRAASAARGVGRSAKEASDVGRAEEAVEAVEQQLAELQLAFKSELDSIEARLDAATEELEKIELKPKKTGITVKAVVLAWEPG